MDRGSESEVLGPLRIWHLVFIIAVILLIVVVIVCCCCDFRLPRTRQEIEENFQKRILNKQYLSVLERRPQELVKRQREGKGVISVTESSRQHPVRNNEDQSKKPINRSKIDKRQQKYEAKVIKATSSKGVKGSRDRQGDSSGYSPVRRPIKIKDTPLATHPRDILALMSQHA